ncbi:helix-turn-helix protein [Kitasatospora sp. SolWspMP-SS2h]|uniref:helix-turn-helix domain-containing protein n=1 Tax=Kitasatospora sp. SolWspMP-SS2h TaxID=1305729 RepID=UPI000DBA0D08|nr:helix-turn-helix transcriptional regulator [Kitasatospora sp. SolWspMP-SS2h]RAJ34630.1 helix-turn-helix protein [Kitasatospora sp. SolWspMP-SS2h]
MSTSPSSNAQAARAALAGRLGELMRDAGLKGGELSVLCGWHHAKTSRILNARAPISDADIRTWCHACGADDRQAEDLVAANRAADSLYVEWRRITRTGLRHAQQARVPLYVRTSRFHAYSSRVVPGALQTKGYAGALLRMVADVRRTPDDVSDAVDARLARSRIVFDGGRRLVVVLEESVLRYRVGDEAVMAGQLGHLLTVMSLPSVSLGIIPFTAARTVWPTESFNVFDDRQAGTELLSAQVTVTAPTDVALYMQVFARFAGLAVHGAAARTLITTAIDALG